MVDVFFCNMDARNASGRRLDWQVLSEDERQRAERFHFVRDHHMFTACRAKLRRLLAERTGTLPESLTFDYGHRGKPSLRGSALSFNLSHAGPWFACAISDGPAIGIDIEHIHPLEDMASMARHFFAPAEVAHLESLPEAQRTHSFFECWTRKEAVIKATGEGVSRPLDSFEVAFGPGVAPALLRLDDQRNPGWPMHTFDPAPDYIAALTSPEQLGEVRIIDLTP
jgi:4'-phosphopantetheinyl transferase